MKIIVDPTDYVLDVMRDSQGEHLKTAHVSSRVQKRMNEDGVTLLLSSYRDMHECMQDLRNDGVIIETNQGFVLAASARVNIR